MYFHRVRFGHVERALTPLLLVALLLTGCAAKTTTTAQSSGPPMNEAASYDGPKARVTVASLECRATNCSNRIGSGMSDMLSTALFQSNRFIVLERGQGLEEVKSEIDLGDSEYSKNRDTAEKGDVEGADVVIVGAITGFKPKESGSSGGVLAIPDDVPVVGGTAAKQRNAYIQLDLRLVDVRTARVVNAVRVEGNATSYEVGGLGGGKFEDIILGGGFKAYKDTPMEKAVSVVLDRAVQEIAARTPDEYYRYGEEGPG